MSTQTAEALQQAPASSVDGWSEQEHRALDALDVPETPSARAMLHQVVKRTGLDPFARQVYLRNRGGRWRPETTIDGFRAIAERQDSYAGQDGPYWCGSDGKWTDVWLEDTPPMAARVGIYRTTFQAPLYATALWREYVAKVEDPETGKLELDWFWEKMPTNQLAKCVESLALRRAFPQALGGRYTAEAMGQADTPTAPTSAAAIPSRPRGRRPQNTETDGPRDTGSPLSPQQSAAAAWEAATTDEVEKIYRNARNASRNPKYTGILRAQITAPDTGCRERFGPFLLRAAAVKANEADGIARIYYEAEAAEYLDLTIPAPHGAQGEKLRDYLGRRGAALRQAEQRAQESAGDVPTSCYSVSDCTAASGAFSSEEEAEAAARADDSPQAEQQAEDARSAQDDHPGTCAPEDAGRPDIPHAPPTSEELYAAPGSAHQDVATAATEYMTPMTTTPEESDRILADSHDMEGPSEEDREEGESTEDEKNGGLDEDGWDRWDPPGNEAMTDDP